MNRTRRRAALISLAAGLVAVLGLPALHVGVHAAEAMRPTTIRALRFLHFGIGAHRHAEGEAPHPHGQPHHHHHHGGDHHGAGAPEHLGVAIHEAPPPAVVPLSVVAPALAWSSPARLALRAVPRSLHSPRGPPASSSLVSVS